MILLTGAAGFIGANILSQLNATGLGDIILVDDLTDGRKCANLVGCNFADYIHPTKLFKQKLPKLTAICHQGAITDTQELSGQKAIDVNYTFSKRLFKLAQKHACPFVYASSAAVYGSGANGFCEEPRCEIGFKPYAVSKAMFDTYVRQNIFGIKSYVIGLRYFNVYGPREQHKDKTASVAFNCFQSILRGDAPAVFEGSEHIKRDFVYVDDVVAVNLFFLNLHNRILHQSGIYNVGTGQARSFLELAECASTIAGGNKPMTVAFPTDLKQGYQRYTQADITKLRLAGWHRPFVSLETGLAHYWRRSFSGRNICERRLT